ncbi:MAG: zinc ribbon domain-containing protein [Lachnospiraceae bacterium]|nr:zinc ribbon domain-containing protein [Lachnospiraceae bacterium]
MAFFDNIAKNLTTMGKQASDKAKEVATITKLSTDIRREEQKIQDVYASIGKRVYEATKELPSAENVDDFNAIEDALLKIEKLQNELSLVRGKKECPNCGEMVAADSKFCNSCGEEIPEEAETEDDNSEESTEPAEDVVDPVEVEE